MKYNIVYKDSDGLFEVLVDGSFQASFDYEKEAEDYVQFLKASEGLTLGDILEALRIYKAFKSGDITITEGG